MTKATIKESLTVHAVGSALTDDAGIISRERIVSAAPSADVPAVAVRAAIPKLATPEMREAFRAAYREGGFWTDRLDYALDRMLERAPGPAVAVLAEPAQERAAAWLVGEASDPELDRALSAPAVAVQAEPEDETPLFVQQAIDIALSAHPKPAAPATAEDAVSDEQLWWSWWRAANKDVHTGDILKADIIAFGRVIAASLRSGASAQPAEGVEQDAKRWNMLPAFFEEYQIDAMKLYRDIDALIAEKGQP